MSFFETFFAAVVPAALTGIAERSSDRLLRHLDASHRQGLEDQISQTPELAKQLIYAISGSDYVLASCCNYPSLLFHWLFVDAAYHPLTSLKIFDAIETACSDELSLDAFDTVLRHLRRRFMTALYWRDLNGLADFQEVSQAMTAMAEGFVQQALNLHYHSMVQQYGVPIGKDSQMPQPLLVIGMGKLGGSELNVSSDIDLIFVFPELGVTDAKAKQKSIDNQQFFNQLGKQLIKTLNETTADGFVFRVDMRLRPYGQSGSLTSHFQALEHYYETQGRAWERFAMIKARIIACAELPDKAMNITSSQCYSKQFYQIVKPFVYRNYVDFSTLESLRRLKAMIAQEVARKGMSDNIKLGPGGIREIEFIAQCLQLIRGGRERELQQRNLLVVLDKLASMGQLPRSEIWQLRSAYMFLRRLEHRLQAYQDLQTQMLPTEEVACERVAWLMGYDNWRQCARDLRRHRNVVSHIFQALIAEPGAERVAIVKPLSEYQMVWQSLGEMAEQPLQSNGFSDAAAIVIALQQFKQSRKVMSLSSSAREKLDVLLPQLLHTVAELEQPDPVLRQLLHWLEAIVTRTSYVLLLVENPQVLHHLVKLFAASSWVAKTLTQMPSLLDELLHPDTLYSVQSKGTLRDELRQRLLRVEADDIETHVEVLRYFRLAHHLHIAACETQGTLGLMKASDYLTLTAEVILEQVLQLAWQDLTRQYGYPEGATDEAPRFLVLGYGKLGGIEMSYHSDLDLVFIYDADIQGMTNGHRPLDNQSFYIRLGQKMIHLMNVRTLSGQLYQVDMRLRPSGNSGLLVSSLAAYEGYQKNDAWVWEHQALVRARPIAGDQALAQHFRQLRMAVLTLKRNDHDLKNTIIKMREKMRNHLGATTKLSKKVKKHPGFHLKQDAGGIVDIEFMVQYAVLAWSYQHPAIAEWTDNIRILESLKSHAYLDHLQAGQLIEIYQSYRTYGHRLALQQRSSVIDTHLFVNEREQVKTIWNRLFVDAGCR